MLGEKRKSEKYCDYTFIDPYDRQIIWLRRRFCSL